MATYKVAGRPLHHNGKRLRVGWKLEMDEQSAFPLVERGRIAPYEKPVRRPRAKG